MVPKIHKSGKSFRGVARYLLHDVDATTRERVEWTEVRNVATRNPEAAWRVLAATAMDQDRLKREAGIPNTGRKSKQHVLHFSLSWHADEAKGLSKAEMMRATNTILSVMGAQEHQALVVCHTDKPQPHVHVIVNRVHPTDGRMLSSSFEKLKASKWAEKYEAEREKIVGKIFCDQRVLNNAARDRGEFKRAKKDDTRHVYDLAKAASNDNDTREQLLLKHRRKAAFLKDAERRLKARHREAWHKLHQTHKHLVKVIHQKTKAVIARNKTQIRDSFRPLWEKLYHEQQAERNEFKQQETALLGRLKNTYKSIDFKQILRRAPDLTTGKATTLGEAFLLLGDAGARLQALHRRHEAARRALALNQKKEEQKAIKLRHAKRDSYLAEARKLYTAERSSLILVQAMEKSKLKAQWRDKGRELRQEIKRLQTAELLKRPLTQEFTLAANNSKDKAQDDGRAIHIETAPARSKTKPSDLLPKHEQKQAARQIDGWQELRDKKFDRGWRQGVERDEDRDR